MHDCFVEGPFSKGLHRDIGEELGDLENLDIDAP
jgi:hypothetical protein